jgi:hypothetical protein
MATGKIFAGYLPASTRAALICRSRHILFIEVALEGPIGHQRHEHAHVAAGDCIRAGKKEGSPISGRPDRPDATRGHWSSETIA